MTESESAVAACSALMARAMFHTDRHESDNFIALFWPDGAVTRQGEVFEGHEAIAQFMASRDPERVTRHILGAASVELTGHAEAKGVAYFTLYEGRAEQGQPVLPLDLPKLVGECHQTYRRGESGWRILSHRSTRIFEQVGVR